MKPLKQGVYSSRVADKFVIRFLEGMRDNIKEIADGQHRSMNSQIVAWIEMCLRIHSETGHAPSVDILLDGVQAAKRCQALEDMLKKLQNSGQWYNSAIEMEHGVNASELYQEVSDLLAGKTNFNALISQFEELAKEMQPAEFFAVAKFVPHVGDPVRFADMAWILVRYIVQNDGEVYAELTRGLKGNEGYKNTQVNIKDLKPL
jgi:hypothetical protein